MTSSTSAGPTTTNRSLQDWLALPVQERHELARDAVRSAEQSKQELNTYISILPADELELADSGELAGVPYAVKDNVDVRGLPTTGGTPSLEGSYPRIDNSAVRALRDAGAVAIGKTNLHELAFGLTSNNGHYGPAGNPHDPTRTSGGSSGGSAATVAYGSVPFSLGTDTGASVTVPASYCGVVGYRPTTGRYPGDSMLHLTWTRDAIGVHANTVADIVTVDRVITRTSVVSPTPEARELRIGVPAAFFEDTDPQIAAAAQEALDALARAGVQLVSAEVPRAMELAAAGFSMVFYESPIGFATYLAQLNPEYARLTVADIAATAGSPDVKKMLDMMLNAPIPSEAYETDAGLRNELRRNYQQAFATSGVDALIFPTAPNLPPVFGNDEKIELNGTVRDMFPTATRNVAPGGLAGAPQLSIPLSRPEGALPIGLTLEGGIGTDDRLLAVGQVLSALL